MHDQAYLADKASKFEARSIKLFWQTDLGLWGDHCKSRKYWGGRWWLILQASHRVSKHDIFLLKVLKGNEDLNEIDV